MLKLINVESIKSELAFNRVTPSSHSGEDAEGRRGLPRTHTTSYENRKAVRQCNRIIILPLHETPWESKISDRFAHRLRLCDSERIITHWKSAAILFFFSDYWAITALFPHSSSLALPCKSEDNARIMQGYCKMKSVRLENTLQNITD